MDTQEFLKKRKFIIQLGKALHKFGTPAYRLETHLRRVASTLGIDGYFLITPTTMTFVLQHDADQEYNHMARVNPGELDLGSLARTDELVNQLLDGERTLDDAIERLQEIADKPAPYGRFMTGLSFILGPAAFAMLMGTSWQDVFWSGVLGLPVYLLVIAAEKSKRMAEMLEPLAAIICAIGACAIAHISPELNIPVVVLSAIIIFIPGLALTLGLAELAARDLMSGTARIMDAMMLMCKLYFGGMLGLVLGHAIFGDIPQATPVPLERWHSWLAVPILSATLVILFKARSKDAPWGIIAGIIAFLAAQVGGIYLGESIGIFVGAFVVGIYANLYSRWQKAPASIALLQGIVILVPGSKTYIGLNALISGEVILNQAQIGAQVFLIFMSLVAGLIFSNVAVTPRSTL